MGNSYNSLWTYSLIPFQKARAKYMLDEAIVKEALSDWSFGFNEKDKRPRRDRRSKKKYYKKMMVNGYSIEIYNRGDVYTLSVTNSKRRKSISFFHEDLLAVEYMLTGNWKKKCLLALKDNNETKQRVAKAIFLKNI